MKRSKLLYIVLSVFLWVTVGPMPEGIAQDTERPDKVWRVKFKGNQQYSSMVLSNQIATEAPTVLEKLAFWDRSGHELSENQLKKDVIRLRNYYQRRGFVNVNVRYNINTLGKSWKKEVVFKIEEQLPIRIQSITYDFQAKDADIQDIRDSRSFQEARASHVFKPGNRYATIREPEVVGRFTDVFKNLGFAYAEVNIRAKVDTMNLTADVTINADIGPRTYIDSVTVEGDLSVSKAYILREAALQRGERYSMDKLQEAQQQLFNHHLFRFATISIPEQPHDSTLNLFLRVRENEKRSIELQAGFGTEEKIRGQFSWTHRNVAHRGYRFTSTAHASFIEQSVNLDLLFPYVYNTKSSIVISPFGQHLLQHNYELLRAGVTNSFIYQYSQHLTSSASYEFTKNQELSKRFDTSLPDTTLQYDLSSFQFSSYYNESLARQQEGWVIQPYVELSGLFGMATFQFQKATIDIRRFTRLGNSTMLATRVQGGGLFNAPTDSLPNNIRFYLGGTNTVRGWYRQQLGPKRARLDSTGFQEYVPVGGRGMLGFNLEIRQRLNFIIEGLGLAVFLDGGQVWQTFRRMNRRPIQFGIGGGLRYRSPIGPVRIDVGYKLNPTDKDLNIYQGQDYGSAWNRIGIHLSIGQAF